MKKQLITLAAALGLSGALSAMDYETAREQAYYLTDKMAYELNLNDEQYDDAFEINLDYLLSLDSETDIDAVYLDNRNDDLRYILYDWQWEAFIATMYFWHPVYWMSGGWYFPIYRHYARDRFFFARPAVYWDYRGAHGRAHFAAGGSFYANRRPAWNGGKRGSSSSMVGHPGGGTGRASGMRGNSTASSNRNSSASGMRGNSTTSGNRNSSASGMRGNSTASGNRNSSASGMRGNSTVSGNRNSSASGMRSSSRSNVGSSSRSSAGSSSRSSAGSSSRGSAGSSSRSSVGSSSRGSAGSSSRSSVGSSSRGSVSSSSRGSVSSSSRSSVSSSSRGSVSSSSRGSVSSSSRGSVSSSSRGSAGGASRGGGGRR